MQKELIALQPELVKTSEETEKLMDVIEHETIEVEAKKEVSRDVTSFLRHLESRVYCFYCCRWLRQTRR